MLDNWSGMPLGRELEPRERESLTGRKKTMKTRYFIFFAALFCAALNFNQMFTAMPERENEKSQ